MSSSHTPPSSPPRPAQAGGAAPAHVTGDRAAAAPGSGAVKKPRSGAARSRRSGNGRSGAAAAPNALAPRRGRDVGVSAAGAKPRYDSGARFDSGLRYASADPVPTPEPGSAKVKLELKSRSNPGLAGFGESHTVAITGNPIYPADTLEPPADVFAAALGNLESVMGEVENHRLAGKALTERLLAVRAEFESLFTLRGNYVQVRSLGNSEAIQSAGLPVRNAPTSVGVLLPPLGLYLDPTTLPGQLQARWQSVTGAKAYMLECAEVTEGEPLVWNFAYLGGRPASLCEGLTSGKTYAFRVCTVGGANGRSAWSPTVYRLAA